MSIVEDVIRVRHQFDPKEEGAVLHGLPSAAYTSEEFFERERQAVFADGWTFVGFVHEAAKPGACVPVEVAGRPLLILANEASEIQVFHNACRHRGLKLVNEPCSVKNSINCPYHAWSYNLNGELEAAPHFGGFRVQEVKGFKKADHGLVPVRSAIWHDWIFVNLSGGAPDFDEYSKSFAAHAGLIDLTNLQVIGKIDLGVVKCNWKFLMENFIEPYHVPIVHHDTASGQPLRDHYTITDGVCLGSGVDLDKNKETTAKSSYLDMSARYLTMFPNFVMGIYLPDQAGVHLNVPIAPDQTRQYRVLYSIGDQHYTEEDKKSLCDLWYAVHKQDHAIAELLQAGRKSPVTADGGLMSPHWENSAHEFQSLVLGSMAK